MLVTVVCETLCGSWGFKPIAQWVRMQEPEIWHWFGFKWRPPCVNCYADLFKVNDETLRAVSIYGKALCDTLQKHQCAVYLLSALDLQTGYMPSQTQVGSKTNEAKVVLPFLKDLVLLGNVVVGDAMFGQRDVCETIIDSGGDYFVVVKKNQRTLDMR